MADSATRVMAAIGGTVAVGTAVAPRAFLRLFGVEPHEVTGAGLVGWRLFAVRIGYISYLAARGDRTAVGAFFPIQLLDQAVFWHAFATRSIRLRAALLAAGTSAAIIALDQARRRASHPVSSPPSV